jgi:plastocyanin
MFSKAIVSSFALALLPFAAAAVIDVDVGKGGLAFSPEAIFAAAGDQVVFHFHPKNHTVTQSSFADPCGPKDGGFNSGFMPVAANTTDNFPTWTITVNDTTPTWVYCAQAAKTSNSHCGAGMVFAINCGQDGQPNSFTNFKKSALAVGASLAAPSATSGGSSGGYGGSYGGYGGGSADSGSSGAATAAYGGVTIAPQPSGNVVTQAITLGQSTWTTTYTSYPGSPAPTPASETGNTIKVVVGGPGKLLFDPPHITAQPRDTVVFEFHEKNHTVTQSLFSDPCRHATINGALGFDSGYFPVASDATTFPTWSLTVNDTAPIWAYCRQGNHCGAGMVFSINSDESSGRNYAAFQSLAKQLNGSSAAQSAPSPSTSADANGALTTLPGVGVVTIVLGAFVAALF